VHAHSLRAGDSRCPPWDIGIGRTGGNLLKPTGDNASGPRVSPGFCGLTAVHTRQLLAVLAVVLIFVDVVTGQHRREYMGLRAIRWRALVPLAWLLRAPAVGARANDVPGWMVGTRWGW
jgi:hypothetical protein